MYNCIRYKSIDASWPKSDGDDEQGMSERESERERERDRKVKESKPNEKS